MGIKQLGAQYIWQLNDIEHSRYGHYTIRSTVDMAIKRY